MEQEYVQQDDSLQVYNKKFNENIWDNLESKSEEYASRVHIKKSFQQEIKKNKKQVRPNKKNPSKGASYFKNLKLYRTNNSHLFDDWKEDHAFQTALPNTITYTYEGLGSRVYNAKFTNDGQILLVTSQKGTAFFKFTEDDQLQLSSVIAGHAINWAITDSDISSDNRFMVHSTLGPNIQMFDVKTSKYAQTFKLNAQSNEEDDDDSGWGWFSSVRVFSLKLSGDNKEIITGCGRMSGGAPIKVYDIESDKVKHSIIAHNDDINTICYVDKKSSSVFISGSDDGLCKLWDTRILYNNQPVGIFYGHVAGLTAVDSREDNKYFISSSKDQSIKLWDLRKASTDKKKVTILKYDYRYGGIPAESLPQIKAEQKKYDDSIMSFWGHYIVGTLIRCHFSPIHSTGQRYVYTGSGNGMMCIYDTISGEMVSCLETSTDEIMRDCAWHPFSQNIITTSFEGEIHRWEYMDLKDAKKVEYDHAVIQAQGEQEYDLDEYYEDIDEEEDDEDYAPTDEIDEEQSES